jgi:hypothetical protein
MTWEISYILLPPGKEIPKTEAEKFLMTNFPNGVIRTRSWLFAWKDKQGVMDGFNPSNWVRAINAWAIDATPSRAKIE